MTAATVVALPIGWTLVAWGAVALAVAAAAAAWSWLSGKVQTGRDGDPHLVGGDLQHAIGAYGAAFAGFLGTLWIVIGLSQAGVAAWIPIAALAAAAAVLLLGARRRRELHDQRRPDELAAAPDQPWSAHGRARDGR